jgi:putative transposase
MAEQFQNKYRIPSARVTWHDYNGGTYFVTICTAERKYYFGEIVGDNCRDGVDGRDGVHTVSTNAQIELSKIGMIAKENFNHVTEHYPYAEIPLFVVMPNHIHAIVIIDDGDDVHIETGNDDTRWKTKIVNQKMQDVSNRKGKLSVVIGGLKRAITRYAHDNGIPFAWQTRFYDHIVRNQDELNSIGEYNI